MRDMRDAKKSSISSAYAAVTVKLSITQFEERSSDHSPPRIWFSSLHSQSPKLLSFYLTFPSDKRKYNDKVRNWSFDFCLYDDFVNQLQGSEYAFVELNDLPRFIVNGIKKYITNIAKHQQQYLQSQKAELGISAIIASEEDSLNIEPSLLDLLLPFQLEGIKYVVRHGGRALLGDDMVRIIVDILYPHVLTM